ncbi:MAG: prepilin-type N-terminal cleavage/methylation domain-containing protein [bacterium]
MINSKLQSGFTLLEVIVAMVIVVIGLILISQTFSTGLRAVRVSDKATVARFLAEQKLTELELEDFSTLQSTSGDFGTDYPEFTWQEEVATTNLDNLLQVNLTISWTEDNATRTLLISKLIANHGTATS